MKSVLLFVCFAGLALLSPNTSAAQNDPESELRMAFDRAAGSEAKILENLESFLKRFPDHRRPEIEREILKLSLKVGDRDKAIAYAEKIVLNNQRDLETLTQLIGLLRARQVGGDLRRALEYSDQLIERVEAALAVGKPGRLSSAQWSDRKERSRASVRFLRGQVLADLGETEKAAAELKRSFKALKLAATAVALGDLTAKRRMRDEAIEFYLQALAISFSSDEEIDRKAVRQKLGELFIAKTGSEQGLGDRLLKTYDQLARERDEYLTTLERPNINAGIIDPMMFKLTRLDGGIVKLADYRGKVIVLNFWATWCGPCRIEMPQFERTLMRFKNDQNVVFFAVNTDEDRPQVKPYLAMQKFKLPVVFAEFLDEHYAVSSIPTTLVLNRQGNISFRQTGFNSREDFVELLSGKIEEAKK